MPMEKSTWRTKVGLAEMLKGGVIMDVTNAEQASIAEEAGAVAVMALERVPSDIRAQGGVARMADPSKVREIMDAVTILESAGFGFGKPGSKPGTAYSYDEVSQRTPTDPDVNTISIA